MAEDFDDNHTPPEMAINHHHHNTRHHMINTCDDHYYGDNSNESADEANDTNRLSANDNRQRRRQSQRSRGDRMATTVPLYGNIADYCISQESDDNVESATDGVDLSVMRECVNCSTQKTSQWRTNGSGHYLCNACGLYKKYNGEDRPPASLVVSRKKNCSAPKQCSNCGTLTSSMWRRTANKQVACNACGLYYKLYGKYRPIEMRKDVVYPRNRYSKIALNNDQMSDDTTHYGSQNTGDESGVGGGGQPVIPHNNHFFKPLVVKQKKVKRKLKSIINTRIMQNIESTDDEKPIDFTHNSPLAVQPLSGSVKSVATTAEPIICLMSDIHKDMSSIPTITDCFRQCAKCGANVVTQFGLYFGHYLCNDCSVTSKQLHNHLEDNNNTCTDHKTTSRKKNREIECSNCGVKKSSEWRRNPSGQPVCNACGLYFKLHLKNRPIHMRRDFITHRKRTAVTHTVPTVQPNTHFNNISNDCNLNTNNNTNAKNVSINFSTNDNQQNESNNYLMLNDLSIISSSKKRKQSNPKKLVIPDSYV